MVRIKYYIMKEKVRIYQEGGLRGKNLFESLNDKSGKNFIFSPKYLRHP